MKAFLLEKIYIKDETKFENIGFKLERFFGDMHHLQPMAVPNFLQIKIKQKKIWLKDFSYNSKKFFINRFDFFCLVYI